MARNGPARFLTTVNQCPPQRACLRYLQCSQQHHHHLLCRSCGRSVEIAGQAVVQWADAVAKQHGYTDISQTLEVFGLCPDCPPPDPAAG
jgi:Fe2+ or Zn2+ uptake regulation protein